MSRDEAKAFQKTGRKALDRMLETETLPAKSLPLPSGSLNLPVQVHTGEPDRSLLPRILSDEIAFRSELLSRVQRAEQALLEAIDQRLYSIDKASLPAIANSLAKLVQVSERLVDRTKDIAIPKQGTQVAGLYAKYEVLQKALADRGLVDSSGRLRNVAQRIAAISVDAQVSVRDAGAPGAGEGGMGTGSLSDGGAPGRSGPQEAPPPTLEGSGASPGTPTDEPLQGDPEAVPDELLPLGPPSNLDGPRRNAGYRKNWRKKRWKV